MIRVYYSVGLMSRGRSRTTRSLRVTGIRIMYTSKVKLLFVAVLPFFSRASYTPYIMFKRRSGYFF